MEKLLFIHHKPTRFNLGDYLCSPQHYFDFGMKSYNSTLFLKNQKYNIILGGGVFDDYGLDIIKKYTDHKIIAWGIGVSEDINNQNNKEIYPAVKQYSAFGTRDINSKYRFLPCVSVFSKITEIKVGANVGVFLNFDTNITSDSNFQEIKLHCKNNNIVFCSNNVYQKEFEHFFSKTKTIITNSYHVAYWGLLSGREVKIIGYSTKFTNLISMFKLDNEKLLKYSRKNTNSLLQLFYEAINSDKYYLLPNHKNTLNKFRQLNIDFANELVTKGLINRAKLKSQNIFVQEFKYKAYIILRNTGYKFIRIIGHFRNKHK